MTEKTLISVILPLKLEWEPCYYIQSSEIAKRNVEKGTRVRVIFARKEYIGVVDEIGINPPEGSKRISDIISAGLNLKKISADEMKLWRFVADYYMCSIGEVYKAAYPTQKTNEEQVMSAIIARKEEKRLKTLESLKIKATSLKTRLEKKKDAIERSRKAEKREEYISDYKRIESNIADTEEKIRHLESGAQLQQQPLGDICLTESQEIAYEEIEEGFVKGKTVLLNGITGSGKTEIYLKSASEAIRSGKNVLYLVPEIALSRQLEERLHSVFNSRLIVYHSRESAARRREAIYKLSTGPYILLGTRSAIFLPHENLGLIIIDEEHDSSYKQGSPAPRYNGRDTAIMLGHIHRCNLLLGSATPSLEAIFNCESGLYSMVTLNERYYAAPDSRVEIIDTKAERKKRGMCGSFSRKLISKIEETLKEGGQVMLLRGRKSYSPIVQCTDCGDIPRCPNCSVSLSYHKSKGLLVCHHCGHEEQFNGICKKCGGPLQPFGYGTQRIEEEAEALFPYARIARLDGDVSQNTAYETQVIKDFSDGRTDMLIGTQIVAKGFDFKGLMLVAVIQADSILGQQDFRADEKAIQLLEQLRGRCGRRDRRGLLVIQTSRPEHPVYKHFGNGENILKSLLEERRIFNYPPYSRIITLIIKDIDAGRLENMSQKTASQIAGAFSVKPSIMPMDNKAAVQVSEPYFPVVDKIAGEYIRNIRLTLMKTPELVRNKRLIQSRIRDIEKENSYFGHIAIDVDPLQ